MITLHDLPVRGQRVLVRADLNCPIDAGGAILDDTRLRAILPTVQYVVDHGGSVVLMSHLGRPKGKEQGDLNLRPVAIRLSELLHRPVQHVPDAGGPASKAAAGALQPGEVMLLENLRFYPGEEKPGEHPDFVEGLAALGDLYVQDAFGTAHRAHASTVALPELFSGRAAIGLLMEKELHFLSKALASPPKPFVLVLGGAKVESKVGLLEALLMRAQTICIGGAIGVAFLHASGHSVGGAPPHAEVAALCRHILELAQQQGCNLLLPTDLVYSTGHPGESRCLRVGDPLPAGAEEWRPMDVGPATVQAFAKPIRAAALVVWNGPLGRFEEPPFDRGSLAVAHAIAECAGITIAGGGETLAAIQAAGLKGRFSHLSTGGGATLELLEHGTLPGIEALKQV